jgi:hypothetical protein
MNTDASHLPTPDPTDDCSNAFSFNAPNGI